MVPVGPPVPAGNQPSVPQGLVQQVSPAQVPTNGGVQIGQSFDGIDFLGSNCGCLPPDTNAAVGNNFVVETVNAQIRVFDKTTGVILLDEPLARSSGRSPAATPTWCTTTSPTAGTSRPSTAITPGCSWRSRLTATRSTDSCRRTISPSVGGFPDYAKMGFNKDAIFISYNDFGGAGGRPLRLPRSTRRPPCRAL